MLVLRVEVLNSMESGDRVPQHVLFDLLNSLQIGLLHQLWHIQPCEMFVLLPEDFVDPCIQSKNVIDSL